MLLLVARNREEAHLQAGLARRRLLAGLMIMDDVDIAEKGCCFGKVPEQRSRDLLMVEIANVCLRWTTSDHLTMYGTVLSDCTLRMTWLAWMRGGATAQAGSCQQQLPSWAQAVGSRLQRRNGYADGRRTSRRLTHVQGLQGLVIDDEPLCASITTRRMFASLDIYNPQYEVPVS